METNFQQANLTGRARRYATIIALLFAKQGLAGKLATAHRGARHLSLGIRLADPTKLDTALKLAEPMALSAGTHAVLAQREAGLVLYQFELAQGYWEYYTRADLPTVDAIGLAEQRRPVVFTFDPPHALVAGTSGSGKTEAIKSALVALLVTNGPDSLGLAIVDPHGDYGDFRNVAHLGEMPIAQEARDFGRLLGFFVSELAQRKAQNNRDGKRLVIVIDEAHEVLADGKNLAMIQILAQGRKYRIHLVIGTQKPLHGDLPKILDNLDNRFVGRVTDAKVSATVTGHAGLQAHKLTGKGDFLHVNGPDVIRFQVAQATRQDFERLPRGETPAPVADDLVDLPAILPDPSQPGRPRIELDPHILAAYWHYGPNRITHKIAAELFGLARTGHMLHRDFCLAFGQELLRLRQKGA